MKSKVWIFDVDGVITDPGEKKVIYPRIYHELTKRLKHPTVVFITGRSFPWLKKKVLLPLIDQVKDKGDLKNLYISCEYGGVQVEYISGNLKKVVGKDRMQDKNLNNKIRKIVKENFSQTMFYDKTKETMITVEMNKGVNNKKFEEDQRKFLKLLKTTLSTPRYSSQFMIVKTTIATDIFKKKLGKDYAIRKILSWIRKRTKNPLYITIFGDSEGDLVMGEELMKHGVDFKFVFVGEKKNVNQRALSFPVIFTNTLYSKGTLEFLQNEANFL